MVRIALLGAGFIGKLHLAAYRKLTNARPVALIENNRELGEKTAKEFSLPYYQSFEEAAAVVPFDALDICVPTFLHETYVLKAAAAGKHILLEKPVTLSLESFERIEAAVKTAGVKLMVAQVLRFWPEYRRVEALYASGELGRVRSVFASRLSVHPAWTAWHQDPNKSGGCLFDLHLHDVDYLVWLFGRVKQVYAAGHQSESGCWNTVTSNLLFENGTTACVESTFEAKEGFPFLMALRAQGEKKTADLRITAGVNIENLGTAQRTLWLFEDGREPVLDPVEIYDGYEREIAYFCDCVEKDLPLERVSMESVRHVLKVLLAVKRSMETDEIIRSIGD